MAERIKISEGKKTAASVLFIACVVATINFFTMPKFFYPADAIAIKLSAVNLVMNGDFGIDFKDKEKVNGFLIIKGNAFHENKRAEKYYQRWGFINTILFALPEIFIDHDEMSITKESIFYHNCYNVLLSVIIAIYLYFISRLYVKLPLVNIGFPFAVLYTTFLWNYMRAQSYDIFQLVFFLIFFYHFVLYHRGKKESDEKRNLVIGCVSLFVLIQVKSFYLILFVCIFFFYLILFLNDKATFARCNISDIWILLAFFLITVLTHMISNKIFYEELFFTKNASHAPYNPEIIPFSLSYYMPRIKDYFFNMPANLFIHFPLFIFSFLGIKKMMRDYKLEYGFILMIFLFSFLVLGAFYSRGEWCYGPRFFLFLLPAISLPAIFSLEEIYCDFFSFKGVCLILLIGAVSIVSLTLQMETNSRVFFLRYRLEDIFSRFQNPEISHYFQNSLSGTIAHDFSGFIENGEGFFPLHKLTDGLCERDKLITRIKLERYLKNSYLSEKNYFFRFTE